MPPDHAAVSGDPLIDPLSLDGAGFSGVTFPLAPVEGELSLAARTARAWTGPDGEHRLLLTGGVDLHLGLNRFAADRAAVWIAETGTPDTYQVFAYLDNAGAPSGDAAASLQASRLPVRAVVRSVGGVRLRVESLDRGRPVDPLVPESERALAARLRAQVGVELWAGVTDPAQPDAPLPNLPLPPAGVVEGSRPFADSERDALLNSVGVSSDQSAPIFPETGVFSFDAGSITANAGDDDSRPSIVMTGGVTAQFWDRATGRTLEFRAQRVVAFLRRGVADTSRVDAASLDGLYLEGAVIASDTDYTLRGEQLYYDITRNRALVLDAVFWTYSRELGAPLYLRADQIRQLAVDEFRADRARIANTRFFEPDFSVGASSVTLSREPSRGGTRTVVDARDITLRAGPLPFFYFPVYKGDPSEIPLRAVALSGRTGSGTGVLTDWSTAGLLGIDSPAGFAAATLIDYYTERGFAFGQRFSWSGERREGYLFAYILPEDGGEDPTPSGTDLDAGDTTRGTIVGAHRVRLDGIWSAFLEVAYFSDETFADAVPDRLPEDPRVGAHEPTNRLALSRTKDDTLVRLDIKANANDFTPNQSILTSDGYTVDRLPELSGFIIGRDLLAETNPGLLSYFGEGRLGALRLRFVEPTAEEFGFDTPSRSRLAFGVEPDESLGDRLRASGLDEDLVTRFDTRHEISAQLEAGAIKITPFATGRATVYDTDFSGFSPNEQDNARLWGSVGTRFWTSAQRIYDGVESRLLGIHRLRHIVEPSITAWHAGTTVDAADLPVFDENVESIGEGTFTRIGFDQTFQTKRGGPGRWRTVDLLRLGSEVVIASDDVDSQSPYPFWHEGRPELSNPGDFARQTLAWQATDAVGFAGETVYDFGTSQQSRSSIGMLYQHNPKLVASAELRFLNPNDRTYVDLGGRYNLTRKYDAAFSTVYDTDRGDLQTVSLTLDRAFPNALLSAGFRYDDVSGVTSFNFGFSPSGVGGTRGVNLSGIGSENDRTQRSSLGG